MVDGVDHVLLLEMAAQSLKAADREVLPPTLPLSHPVLLMDSVDIIR